MKTILLSRGLVAIIDDDDFERVSEFNWTARTDKGKRTHYAQRNIGGTTQKLHRFILSAPDGVQVDHKDGDGLNNCKSNLRLCSNGQNKANCGKQKNGESRYKGVSPCFGKWRARTKIDGKLIHLGLFPTEEEAARAYDSAALQNFGEFARLNFS